MGWCRRRLVLSLNALVVLAAAIHKAGDEETDDKAEQLYRRWLCLTALRGTFGGSIDSTITKFYKASTSHGGGNPADALLGGAKKLRASQAEARRLPLPE